MIQVSRQRKFCSVSWDCRIYWLLLFREVRHLNECPGCVTKQSDGLVPVMLELWGMQSTPLLSSFPGPHWPREVAPDRILSMGQIELNCLLMLSWIVWNRTVFDIETAYLCQTELFGIEQFLTLKLRTYAKLNCFYIELNYVLILNWTVWNRTVLTFNCL